MGVNHQIMNEEMVCHAAFRLSILAALVSSDCLDNRVCQFASWLKHLAIGMATQKVYDVIGWDIFSLILRRLGSESDLNQTLK